MARFSVHTTNWAQDQPALQAVRIPVFVHEQKVEAREEFDAVDPVCDHILAIDEQGNPIGTGRIDANGKIGRMAVLSGWRQYGVGREILRRAIDLARLKGLKRVYLYSQVSALGFYSREGFHAYGEHFYEAGIEHQAMELKL